METETQPVSPETWAFRIYAILAGAAGFVLSSWGMIWFGSDLPGLLFYKASLIRVAGGVLMTAACFAWALERVEDFDARRRALLWFGIGHTVLFLVLVSQQLTIWNSPAAERVATVVLLTALAFFYVWSGFEADPPAGAGLTVLKIFPAPSHTSEDLRRRYRRQIREAALQEERHRLARDLHDSVKQQIFAIQTSAAAAQVRFDADPSGARAALDQVRSSAREAMAEMEAMLDQLRAAPLENAGLVASIRKQCEALGFRTGAQVEFEAGTLPDSLALEPGAQESLFRVAQEALANVARHARASRVHVSLGAAKGYLKLLIEDDGGGFDPAEAPRGMGIANMKARAAEFNGVFELSASRGEGVRVSVAMPLKTSPNLADMNRRIAWYAAFSLLHFAIAVWQDSAMFVTLGVMWAVYGVRLAGVRRSALRGGELVQ